MYSLCLLFQACSVGADLEGPNGNLAIGHTVGRGGHTRPGYRMWVYLWEDGEKIWVGRSERLTRLDPGEEKLEFCLGGAGCWMLCRKDLWVETGGFWPKPGGQFLSRWGWSE